MVDFGVDLSVSLVDRAAGAGSPGAWAGLGGCLEPTVEPLKLGANNVDGGGRGCGLSVGELSLGIRLRRAGNDVERDQRLVLGDI